jgi:hypothetical protein
MNRWIAGRSMRGRRATSDDARPLHGRLGETDRAFTPDDSEGHSSFGPSPRECHLLLQRVGVDAAYWGRSASGHVRAPAAAAAYLSKSNPRLLELQALYRDYESRARYCSQWSSDYVSRDVPLLGFRGDCAFVWQRRDFNTPLNYLLTASHLRHEAADLLQLLDEDGCFGAYTVSYGGRLVSRDLLDSINEIVFLDRTVGLRDGTEHRVLDIGSGYGRLAHRITEACQAVSAVICADAIAEATFICEYYLRYRNCSRAHVVPLPEVEETVSLMTPDIAVSCHCFDECPMAAIRWWLALLRRHSVRHLMIVPGAKRFAERGLVSLERDGEGVPMGPLLEEQGYRLVSRQPKYGDPSLQRFGVSPTYYLLYSRD